MSNVVLLSLLFFGAFLGFVLPRKAKIFIPLAVIAFFLPYVAYLIFVRLL